MTDNISQVRKVLEEILVVLFSLDPYLRKAEVDKLILARSYISSVAQTVRGKEGGQGDE